MELARAAARFPMPRASRALSAHDHFAAMVFAQLTYRESLRGIEAVCSADKTTLRDMLGAIRRRYGEAERIWIMDRGIPTEDILAELRTRCYDAFGGNQ